MNPPTETFLSAPSSMPDVQDWNLYRALREQWTHEDNLINQRLMWLNLSQGLLFTAFGTLTNTQARWLTYGFPLFGIAVAFVIALSVAAARSAAEDIERRFHAAGLDALCELRPRSATPHGSLAARMLPFVFGALWVLAMFGFFEHA
jgi:hypothetical protein